MSANKYAVLLTMSVLAAYLYLQVPLLRQYSLQVFAGVTVIYLWLQKNQRGHFSLILPESYSINLVLLNFAFLLLIGASGALESPLFAVSLIQLFFLALVAPTKTVLLVVMEIMVFYLSLTVAWTNGLQLSHMAWSNLAVLPVATIFYLFAKVQYDKAYRNSLLMQVETQELLRAKSDDEAVRVFLSSLINRRLPMLEFLLSFPESNRQAIDSEVVVLKRDINLLLRHIDAKHQLSEQSSLDQLLDQVEHKTKGDHEQK